MLLICKVIITFSFKLVFTIQNWIIMCISNNPTELQNYCMLNCFRYSFISLMIFNKVYNKFWFFTQLSAHKVWSPRTKVEHQILTWPYKSEKWRRGHEPWWLSSTQSGRKSFICKLFYLLLLRGSHKKKRMFWSALSTLLYFSPAVWWNKC